MVKELKEKDLKNLDIHFDKNKKIIKSMKDIIKLFNKDLSSYQINYITISLCRDFENQIEYMYSNKFDFPIAEKDRENMIEVFKWILSSIKRFGLFCCIIDVMFIPEKNKKFIMVNEEMEELLFQKRKDD